MTREELELEADMLLQEAELELVDHTDTEAIACKTGKKNKELFRRLCEEKMGCTMNEALQMVIDCLIRYMDDRHNLSEELNTMISLFEGFKRWGNHINLTEPISRNEIIAAIYILARRDKEGRRLVMVDGADGDLTRSETFNIKVMMEMFMEVYDELMYRKLRAIASEMGCMSISEALHKLVDSYQPEDENGKHIRSMFEDNRRGEFGQQDIPEDGPYRRTMHFDVDEQAARIEAWNRRQTSLEFPEWNEDNQINDTF